MSDILRQVDEELRKEKLSNFWKKYKYFFIFFVLLMILAVSGIQFNQYKKSENRKIFVEKYFESFDSVNVEAKINNLKEINAPNVFTDQLLNLQIANSYFENENDKQGLIHLEKIFNQNEKSLLGDLALYKYIMFQLDTLSKNEISKLIENQSKIDHDFEYLFKELIAIKMLIDGEVYESKREFELILNNTDIPFDIKTRAEKYINTIE